MTDRAPDFEEFARGPVPPPPGHADYVRVYVDSDAALHVLESDGTDTEIGAGGGSMTYERIDAIYTNADLIPIIVGGFAFYPLPGVALQPGDVVIEAGCETTEDWDDSGAPTFGIVASTSDPSVTSCTLAPGSCPATVQDTSANGGLLFFQDGDPGSNTPAVPAIVQQGQPAALVYVVAGMAGDGATGEGIARLLIARAP